jgi:hypothetical protein
MRFCEVLHQLITSLWCIFSIARPIILLVDEVSSLLVCLVIDYPLIYIHATYDYDCVLQKHCNSRQLCLLAGPLAPPKLPFQ